MSDIETIGLPNAPWWLNHSTVIAKADRTAADDAWIQKNLMRVNVNGSGSNATPEMKMGDKDFNILLIERLVQPGSVVAVKRSQGRTKTVNLPSEAGSLLITDLAYIVSELNKLNEPIMDEEQQAAFLLYAKEQSRANS